jgi:uncharacterized membrane protein
MKRFALAIGLVAGLLWLSAPAEAQLELCNRTSYILYAAVAVDGKAETTAQGWTRIVPGECKTAVDNPLGKTGYYTYARTSAAHAGPQRAWGGSREFCALDSSFRLTTPWTATRCQAEEATMLPFARIDTKGQAVWAMTFTESRDIATVDAARTAGLKRLLRDSGMKIAAIDGKPDKATEDALSSFRKRMKMAADAGSREMFDALETEALKSAAPAGYSICNDTDGVVWAAMAFPLGRDWLTRGWWKVPAGTCSKAVTQPLNTDRVFLHAEKHGNDKLVSGPEKFCLTNIEFEIQGRGNCAKRMLEEVGFATTNTKGLTGYTAHIGNQGLMPALKTRPK